MDALSNILISKIMIEIIIIGFDRLNGLIFPQWCVNSVWSRGLGENQLSKSPGSIPRAVIFVLFFYILYFIFLTHLDIYFIIDVLQWMPWAIF